MKALSSRCTTDRMIYCRCRTSSLLLLLSLSSSSIAIFCCCCRVSALSVRFRRATFGDVAAARKLLLAEKMNPLSLSEERLLVAYDDANNGVNDQLIGFGQIRPLSPEYSELASLFVVPRCRGEGVGSALVEQLLSLHDENEDDKNRKVCLLTLRPTCPFYERCGFQTTDDLSEFPLSFRLEYAAGTAVSALLGNDLVCMVRERAATNERIR